MCIYIYFFRFLSLIGSCKIWNRVPSVRQYVPVVYLVYIELCVSANPKFLIDPSLHVPPGNPKFVSCVCDSLSSL